MAGERPDLEAKRQRDASAPGSMDGRPRKISSSPLSGTPARKFSVLLLDTKTDNVNYYIVLSILEALRNNARVSHVEKADYAAVVRRAQSFRFDLLLAVDGEAINIDILARLKTLVGTAILWTWEDPYERDRSVALSALFGLVFTNDGGSVAAYPPPACHLPLAGSQSMPVRSNDADYDYDLSFVGSAWPSRVVFLRRLLRTMPHLRTRIVLSYNAFLPKSYLDLPESSYVGTVSHHDFLHIANRSRINLTLGRDFCGDGMRVSAQTPGPRIFEVALAGGYQIVDGSTNKVNPFFAPGKEVGVYTQLSDCVGAIKAALADPALRISRAVAAQTRALREHTYVNRIDAILDNVERLAPPPAKADDIQAVQPNWRRRILFVTHNTIAGANFGGVEVYQETIADEMRAEFDMYYYRPTQPAVQDGRRRFVLTDDRHNVIATYSTPDFDVMNALSQAEAEAHFALVLTKQSIDLVHFQHLIGHCISLPIVARMLGVPCVAGLLDFWLVCTRFNLLDNRGIYCKIAERPRVVCDLCLRSADGIVAGAQDYRRRFLSGMLAGLDRLLGVSESSVAIFRGIYPDLASDAFTVIGLPVPHPVTATARPSPATTRDRDLPLRVVFLGNFTTIKGAQTFLEAAGMLRDDNIAFTICGRIDPPYDAQLSLAKLENVTVEGGFRPGELELTRFEVSLHLSIWPETYCITLSEAWKAGLVPIVTTCGALEERVTDGEDGYHIPVEGAGELVALLRRIEGNRQELQERRASISPRLFLSAAQHCVGLHSLYMELLDRYRLPHRPSPPRLETGNPTTFALRGQRLTPPYWTHPDDFPLPSPQAACEPPLSPLRRQLQPVESALRDGRVNIVSPIYWHIDSIGLFQDPYWRNVAPGSLAISWKKLPRGPVQLVGWLRSSVSMPPDLMLAVRSAARDLILRPAYLHDRADLQDSAVGGRSGVGFVTGPFPPEMLELGVYGIELVSLQDRILEVVPIAALLVTREDVSCIMAPGQTTIRVLLPGAAWQASPPIHAEVIIGVVDNMAIVPALPDDLEVAPVLLLSGWAFVAGAPGRIAHTALQLSGAATFHVALRQTDRPDVVDAMNTGVIVAPGYEGAVSLSFLPSGTYMLELIKHLPHGVATRRLGEVCVDAHGHARVERYIESSEIGGQILNSIADRSTLNVSA